MTKTKTKGRRTAADSLKLEARAFVHGGGAGRRPGRKQASKATSVPAPVLLQNINVRLDPELVADVRKAIARSTASSGRRVLFQSVVAEALRDWLRR